jgi:hypothetical protein
LPKLERIVKKYDLKLTAFATGKTLEENSDVLDSLKSMKSEIEQHSYYHEVGHLSKIDDIQKGIKTHEKLLGNPPVGYRAPQGIITKKEALFLEENGIRFDSSIFPAFFPGRYNRMNSPTVPHRLYKLNLVEIPLGVIPHLRIPISLSYIQLLGLRAFKMLLRLFGLPELIVYDLHAHDLGKLTSYKQLPVIPKVGYYRAQHTYRDQADVLEESVKYFLSKGYRSSYMIDVYNEIQT